MKGGEEGEGINRRYRKVHVASSAVGKFAYYVLSFYNSNTVLAFLLGVGALQKQSCCFS